MNQEYENLKIEPIGKFGKCPDCGAEKSKIVWGWPGIYFDLMCPEGHIWQYNFNGDDRSKAIMTDELIMKLEEIQAKCKKEVPVVIDTEARCFPAHLIEIEGVSVMDEEVVEALGHSPVAILTPNYQGAMHFRLPQVLKVHPEYLARFFHTWYEALAPEFSYETRKASAKPWDEVPENNKKLMIAVCTKVADEFQLVDFGDLTPMFANMTAKWMKECELAEKLEEQHLHRLAELLNEAMDGIRQYRDTSRDTTLIECPNCKKSVDTGWMCCPWCAHPVGEYLDHLKELHDDLMPEVNDYAEAIKDVKQFMLNEEDNIANSIEGYGKLQGAFKTLHGRNAGEGK